MDKSKCVLVEYNSLALLRQIKIVWNIHKFKVIIFYVMLYTIDIKWDLIIFVQFRK